jgi:hypothetical protein
MGVIWCFPPFVFDTKGGAKKSRKRQLLRCLFRASAQVPFLLVVVILFCVVLLFLCGLHDWLQVSSGAVG